MKRFLQLLNAQTLSLTASAVALFTAITVPALVRILPERLGLPVFILHCVIVIVGSILGITFGALPKQGHATSSKMGIAAGIVAFITFFTILTLS